MARATLSRTAQRGEQKQERSLSSESSRRPLLSGPHAEILALQGVVGNRVVSQLLRATTGSPALIQTKLTIGKPGDKYEQEADRVAEQVMRMPEPRSPDNSAVKEWVQKPHIQRLCPACEEELQRQPMEEEEEEKKLLQAKTVLGRTSEVTPDLNTRIQSLRSGGRLLPESTRAFFESRFGYDFSEVRVHTDARAAESARKLNALAYTVGYNIGFGAGEYAPDTVRGQKLIAHELTHVLQQKGKIGRIQRQNQEEKETKRGETGSETKPQTVNSDPCGGKSKAKSYSPTSKGMTVELGEDDFGTTSKLAAFFTFNACKVKNDWRFSLNQLTVKIASKVKPHNFRINVDTANDKVVTRSTYQDIIEDLRPNRRVRIRVTCAGNRFIDRVDSYSLRKKYWKRQLVVAHEAFHRDDWNKMYRKELLQAEKEIWTHSIPANQAHNAEDAIKKARPALTKYMISAYQRTCRSYAPQQESRAYDHGKPRYQKLVDDIRVRAKKEKW